MIPYAKEQSVHEPMKHYVFNTTCYDPFFLELQLDARKTSRFRC